MFITLTSAQSVTSKARLEAAASLLVFGTELGAHLFSEGFTRLALGSLNSGVRARRWYETNGAQIGWAAARALGALLVGLVCLACYTWYAAQKMYQACQTGWCFAQKTWQFTQTVWARVNVITDDGLGLYGPSPLLAKWFAKPAPDALNLELAQWFIDRYSINSSK